MFDEKEYYRSLIPEDLILEAIDGHDWTFHGPAHDELLRRLERKEEYKEALDESVGHLQRAHEVLSQYAPDHIFTLEIDSYLNNPLHISRRAALEESDA